MSNKKYSYKEAYDKALEYYEGEELPAKVFIDKYALRDNENNYLETNPNQTHARTSKELHRIECTYPNPRSYEEIYNAQKDFKYFSLQGSGMFGVGNPYSLTSYSNCFVVDSPKDSIEGIMDTGKELAIIFANRGGVGLEMSTLRPEGVAVSNAARTTSGAWSFSDYYSNVCRQIAQNGRRGALMISMDVRHPDVFKFIDMKKDKTKVTGANVSVKAHDEFMQAVVNDSELKLRWPVDSDNPSIVKSVKASDIFNKLCQAAKDSAEPGIFYWDAMLRNLPAECYADFGFKHQSCNPCGELILPANDSCRLLSMNLLGFVKNPFCKNAEFDFELFREKVRLAQRMMDNFVDLEIEAVGRLIKKSDDKFTKNLWRKVLNMGKKGRRTGLGYSGLGDTLAQLRLTYGSPKALKMVESIDEALCYTAYEESVVMAKERGPFEIFDNELEKDNEFIKRLPRKLRKTMSVAGRRNISILTNAPTGSFSLVAGNISSGIEPVFSNSYKRRKKINPGDTETKIDFIDDLGDKWQEFSVFHSNVKKWINKNVPNWDGVSEVKLPSYFVTSADIKPIDRIKTQAIITKYRDHSVSSTINLPKDTTLETIKEIYLEAWKRGLKGITVYVDGSRSGVLVTDSDTESNRPVEITVTQAPKRPTSLPCDIYHGTVEGVKWTIIVGLLEGRPYELFGGPADKAGIPNSALSGYLRKEAASKKVNKYNLTYTYKNKNVVVEDISSQFENEEQGTFTRMLSLSLRHGAPVHHLVEQLGKNKHKSLYSLASVLKRSLKKYIKDGLEVSGLSSSCTECKSDSLIYQEGCVTCTQCGHSKCG